MKKVLALLGLGALLVAGSALPAAAASQVDFSGYYRLYFSNLWNKDYGDKDSKVSDSAFTNRLNLDFTFRATDEVAVLWRLRAPNAQRWGDSAANTAATTVFAFGEVKQDWGTLSIGKLRESYSYTGLSNLGWRPNGADGSGVYTAMNPFDIADDAFDGIRYSNRWDSGFQLVAQFNRLKDVAPPEGGTIKSNQSSDLYILEPAYFWDGGGATLGLHYLRDHAGFSTYYGHTAKDPAVKMYYLNPAFSHRLDNGIGIHFEGKAGSGTDDYYKAWGGGPEKLSGYGAYADVDYKYGPGNVNLAGWWTSGDDGSSTDKTKDAVGMGRTFKPLLVAYGNNASPRLSGVQGGGAVNLANSLSGPGTIGQGLFGTRTNGDQANHWAVDLNGSHKLTDDITMIYALAYLSLNKADEGAKKDIGTEADLSFQIQLLDNLRLGTSFGYPFAGKALDDKDNDIQAAAAYAWFNSLTFSF
jgi:hypothetical protein